MSYLIDVAMIVFGLLFFILYLVFKRNLIKTVLGVNWTVMFLSLLGIGYYFYQNSSTSGDTNDPGTMNESAMLFVIPFSLFIITFLIALISFISKRIKLNSK